MTNFHRIVIAGGPASGKTDTWRALSNEFPELYPIPETATMLINSFGLTTDYNVPFGNDLRDAFWDACWKIQELAERLGDAQARVLGKQGVLLDRALADHAAYLENPDDDFARDTGLDLEQVMRRYDLVIFLEGPKSQEEYEQATMNGVKRLEESFEANQDISRLSLLIWKKHPAFYRVPFSARIEDKLAHVRRLVSEFISRAK